MILRTFDEWQHCIVQLCKTDPAKDIAGKRLAV